MINHSQPCLGEQEVAAVVDVLNSGMLIGGEPSRNFRKALARFLGIGREVALFASGRLAIQAALLALELPAGSKIVVQSYVCDAALQAISEAGHRPLPCDLGDGWTADVKQMETVFTSDCRAILLAPPFGFQQKAEEFRKFGVPIIHDLCQASPKLLASNPPNTFGEIVCFSFHPTKYLCAGGGGSAIDITGKYEKNLLQQESFYQDIAPFTEIHAALASVQLARIDEFEARRAEIYGLYLASASNSLTERLRREIDVQPGDMFRFPLDLSGGRATDIFPIFAKDGIIARQGVDQLIHRILGLNDRSFPNSMRAFRNTISPPFFPALGEADIRLVASSIAALQ